MLEEIMRKGTHSLGTDTTSEREIKHLTARSEEEFWLFEKMDDERRQKEGYRSRLMEDHEVPDWAYSKPGNPKDMRGKGFDYETANLSGKRRKTSIPSSSNNRNIVEDDVLEVKSVSEEEETIERGSQSMKRSRSPKSEHFGVRDGSSFSRELPTWQRRKKRSKLGFAA
ncbi:hypothetical protein Tco_1385022 [Tanacetum coccineum]